MTPPVHQQPWSASLVLEGQGTPLPATILGGDFFVAVSGSGGSRETAADAGTRCQMEVAASLAEAILTHRSAPLADIAVHTLDRVLQNLPEDTNYDFLAIRGTVERWEAIGVGAFRLYHVSDVIRHAWRPHTKYLIENPGGDPDADRDDNRVSRIWVDKRDMWKGRFNYFSMPTNPNAALVVLVKPSWTHATDLSNSLSRLPVLLRERINSTRRLSGIAYAIFSTVGSI